MKESFNNLFNLNPRYSSSIAFILGLILIDNLSTSQQNLIGNWIILLGQTMLTNAASQSLIEKELSNNNININSKKVKCIYNPAFYNIDELKKIIDSVYPSSNDDIETLSKIVDNLKCEIDKLKKSN